ncbi:Gfo/Idh/MocA family protein [Paenibacillus mucilaginosus]|uniref:Oxidoreductase domain-containing protein n=3 Tax=Paenibacillus mucilaginosus TaxID=61624 RepID=H6NFH6_9BACL|nr:Gfo/Idh/MocA family oxidoreductase [Paenibacillus mucilaginosus]AEI41525.1 oxidoreductase domain protein [Paenibacillus mucilaginosus KNP414]AFC30062.1 oxidoreductase domain-containing protein [Paenibacillus mucilaginosus 3016]AFH62322.1 oxidoreductase [Paenibacillus mucilaginosus K02]MCG7215435.1 Gfo/Idh/MocA family oxidoreductase [Paenibacillus mucilaginosus]WDM30533.1 Gfo/Idh/MocA family oxidoreductase [Paenibacillus mucilaginosus]
MSPNDKLHIGVIGAGNIGNVHIQEFQKLPDVVITAVTDVYQPMAISRAKEYGIPTVHVTYQDLLQDPNVDAVVVAVPNESHAPIAIEALRAGKHVLLEKPMAVNAASAKEIVKAHLKSGKVLMMAHQMRWEPLNLQVKEQIDKGALGKIYNVKTGWLRRKGIPGWGTWFTQMHKAGGGPLIDIGVHMLDLSLHLMGSPKPVSVFGTTYAEFGPKKKGIGTWGKPDWNGFYDVEDLATALIKLDNGSTLSLDVSWAANTGFINNGPYIYLMGSDGGASLQGDKGTLHTELFDRTADVDLVIPQNDEGARVRMSRHFVDCVRENREPITSAMSGLTNSLVLEAIYESSRTGNVVKLDWNLD